VATAVVAAGTFALLPVGTAGTAAAATNEAPALTFGIYPAGYAGGGSTNGKPDDPAKIGAALNTLQAGRAPFLLRDYTACGAAFPDPTQRYLAPGRKLDVALYYSGESMPDWRRCVRKEVQQYGPIAETLSVTSEENVHPQPAIQALTQGVVAARQTADQDGFPALKIGFGEVAYDLPGTTSSAPWRDLFLPFWHNIAAAAGPDFAKSVDFVAVDLYPNGGIPHITPVPSVTEFIDQTLNSVRNQEMPIAGLGGNIPIRVGEIGWSTYRADRTQQDQAQALTSEILRINTDRGVDNVVSVDMFGLRDDVTGSANPFDGFGLMTDDYTPKTMFWIYSGLITTLGKH
jgi:hypothetical protein